MLWPSRPAGSPIQAARSLFCMSLNPVTSNTGSASKKSPVKRGSTRLGRVFRLFARKLKLMGFDDQVPEEIIREGNKAEEIVKAIEEDEDIAILVLGLKAFAFSFSAPQRTLQGPALATELAAFPVPIVIVPGDLSSEEIRALA